MAENLNESKLSEKVASQLPESQMPKNQVEAPGRRKLVIGSSAVLATLASGSAMGDGGLGYMCSPSGFMSGNASSHDTLFSCGGISPGGWWQNAEKCGNQDGSMGDWINAGAFPFPEDYLIGNGNGNGINVYDNCSVTPRPTGPTTFYSVFAKSPSGGDQSTSLWETMNSTPGSGSVEWHVVAGWLNARLYAAMGVGSGISFYIAPSLVVEIYQQYRLQTYYETSAGDKLYAEDIKNYFDRTYH